MLLKILITVFFIVIIFTTFSFADIIHVPSDTSTIQGGIYLASDGDTVLVAEDTYYENINFNGKNIVVGSLFLTTGDTNYISQTVIDGDSSESVVTFENGEDSTAILMVFTITNGYAWCGGGIFCYLSSNPTLKNLNVYDNSAWDDGGGIYCLS